MDKEITLAELAELVQGVLVGNARFRILGAAPVESAGPGDITFAENPKALSLAVKGRAGAIIGKHGDDLQGKPGILVQCPRLAFAKVLEIFALLFLIRLRIHPKSIVDETAVIGKNVRIA